MRLVLWCHVRTRGQNRAPQLPPLGGEFPARPQGPAARRGSSRPQGFAGSSPGFVGSSAAGRGCLPPMGLRRGTVHAASLDLGPGSGCLASVRGTGFGFHPGWPPPPTAPWSVAVGTGLPVGGQSSHAAGQRARFGAVAGGFLRVHRRGPPLGAAMEAVAAVKVSFEQLWLWYHT